MARQRGLAPASLLVPTIASGTIWYLKPEGILGDMRRAEGSESSRFPPHATRWTRKEQGRRNIYANACAQASDMWATMVLGQDPQ